MTCPSSCPRLQSTETQRSESPDDLCWRPSVLHVRLHGDTRDARKHVNWPESSCPAACLETPVLAETWSCDRNSDPKRRRSAPQRLKHEISKFSGSCFWNNVFKVQKLLNELKQPCGEDWKPQRVLLLRADLQAAESRGGNITHTVVFGSIFVDKLWKKEAYRVCLRLHSCKAKSHCNQTGKSL